MPPDIYQFPSHIDLANDLAARIADLLCQAIRQRGSASLIVSGGNTPKTLFQVLSQKQLEWQHVQCILADERWVPENHRDSNAQMVREHLLQNRAVHAQFTGLKSDHSEPSDAVQWLDEQLKKIATPVDVVILGMGNDGHTASLFPRADTLQQALSPTYPYRCINVRPAAAPDHQRMSLCLNFLTDSRQLILHLTGRRKWLVLQQALAPDADPLSMPISAILQQEQVPVAVYYTELTSVH